MALNGIGGRGRSRPFTHAFRNLSGAEIREIVITDGQFSFGTNAQDSSLHSHVTKRAECGHLELLSCALLLL